MKNNSLLNHASLKITIVLLAAGLGLFLGAQPASASATLTLAVNPTTIINGQAVTISWYIDSAVTSCSINNGIGEIDISSLPASDSIVVIPPENSSTDYILNCDGSTDTVTVAIKPIVNISFPEGDTVRADISGRVERLRIKWDSLFATQCGAGGAKSHAYIWYEKESMPGQKYNIDYWQQSVYGETSGYVTFYGTWEGGSGITDTATFYLECENEVTGVSAIGSSTLTVLNPLPPSPPSVTVWADDENLSISTTTGHAIASVKYISSDVSWCTTKAYYANGTEYAVKPIGWGYHRSSTLSFEYNYIQISTTTDFEVTCGRPELTIGTTTYPAASSSEIVRVSIAEGATSDRLNLPPVIVTFTATPTPAMKNPDTGTAGVFATISPQNADYCLTRAYDMEGNDLPISRWTENNPRYSWDRRSGTEDSSPTFELSTTTRLVVECRRQADYLSASTTIYDWGTETVEMWVEVIESPVSSSMPVAHVYGNAVNYDAPELVALATNIVGFTEHHYGHDRPSIRNIASSSNTITFPFQHPYGDEDVYDIYIRVCDKNSGESTFKILDINGNSLGSYTTDNHLHDTNSCRSSGSTVVKPIVSGLALKDGDLITLTCDTPNDGEACVLYNVYFGAGDGGSITVPVSSSTGFSEVSLMWMSEYTTSCIAHQAETVGGITYDWSHSNRTYGFTNSQISTTTEFSLACERFDGVVDETSVEVGFPTDTVLVASASVVAGECIDPVSLDTIDAPLGYMAGAGGLCVPAVDLAAASPAVSLASAVENNIAGTYDNLSVLMLINNLGPGELLADSSVAYLANVTIQPIFSLPVINSLVGYYEGSLIAPSVPTNPTQSVTLNRTLDGVPFGTHMVCSRVNLDAVDFNLPEFNDDKSNNTNCRSVTLAVPPPPMELTADNAILRSGQNTSINWSVNVTYELQCTVKGAGGLDESFNTLSFTNPYTGSFTTGAINSTSEYVLQCTEPITDTTFTEVFRVEVVPKYEEL